jgi:hypothetical protein
MTNPTARSKTANQRRRRCARASAVTAIVLLAGTLPAFARVNLPVVPLPTPRPASAPTATSPDKSTTEPAEAPVPSACRLGLTEDIAIAPSLPPIHGPGGCGGDDLVRLEAVVLPDTRRVALKPAATLRCTMAAAIADWVRTDVAALAASLNTAVSEIDNFDSFECRGRNRVAGAQLSEHGKANALDVRSLKFSDGRELKLTDRTADRSLRESVLHSMCARFSTVLGPDSDWYHEDHIHLDLAERRNNYRICEWDVLDPLPAIAPLLPAARPSDAPPREAAEEKKGTSSSDDQAKADAAPTGARTAPERPAAPATATRSAAPAKTKSKGRHNRAPPPFDLRKLFSG